MNQYTDTDEGFIVGNIWENRFGDSVKIISISDSGHTLVKVLAYSEKYEYVVDRNGKVHEDRLSAGDLIRHHYIVGFGNTNRRRNG
jgi:hypothetical protein